MGKRKDAVTKNGKQYLLKNERVQIDLEGSLDSAITTLQQYKSWIGDADHYLTIEHDVDYGFGGDLECDYGLVLEYQRLETDEERTKRLERNRKQQEKERKRKEEQKQREIKMLQSLKKKYPELV